MLSSGVMDSLLAIPAGEPLTPTFTQQAVLLGGSA